MEKQKQINQVLYKGVMVPARSLEISKGKFKLVPITDKYTLYGIPCPNDLTLTNKIKRDAREIISLNNTGVKRGRQILINYIRKGKGGHILGSSPDGEDSFEYFLIKGEPYGVILAFLHENKLKIGWSKRLEGLKIEHGREVQREPLSFTKKDAVNIAVIRGMIDGLIFRGSSVYTLTDKVVPKIIAKALLKFIKHAEKYFGEKAVNVNKIITGDKTHQDHVTVDDTEKECPTFKQSSWNDSNLGKEEVKKHV